MARPTRSRSASTATSPASSTCRRERRGCPDRLRKSAPNRRENRVTPWAAALGSDVDEDSTAEKAFVEATGWGGPSIWFTRVPEPKSAKNRMHLDLRAPGAMNDEVHRLERLGATVLRRGSELTTMADPEGNEFCVEPGPATE